MDRARRRHRSKGKPRSSSVDRARVSFPAPVSARTRVQVYADTTKDVEPKHLAAFVSERTGRPVLDRLPAESATGPSGSDPESASGRPGTRDCRHFRPSFRNAGAAEEKSTFTGLVERGTNRGNQRPNRNLRTCAATVRGHAAAPSRQEAPKLDSVVRVGYEHGIRRLWYTTPGRKGSVKRVKVACLGEDDALLRGTTYALVGRCKLHVCYRRGTLPVIKYGAPDLYMCCHLSTPMVASISSRST